MAAGLKAGTAKPRIDLYDSAEKLATAMRVKEIITIPEMEGDAYSDIVGVIVNMNDYAINGKNLDDTRYSGFVTKAGDQILTINNINLKF